MNIDILNVVAVLSLLAQMLRSSTLIKSPDWLGFLGFIFYPIVILSITEKYGSCSVEEKKLFVNKSIKYSILLLLTNMTLMILKKEITYATLFCNNLFLSFLVFTSIKKLVELLKSNRLSEKCNSLFALLLITSLYVPFDNNFLCIGLYYIFSKFSNKKLYRNITIIILSLLNPLLTGNFNSMGILLSVIFINELKQSNSKKLLSYKKYLLLVFIFLFISIATKTIL